MSEPCLFCGQPGCAGHHLTGRDEDGTYLDPDLRGRRKSPWCMGESGSPRGISSRLALRHNCSCNTCRSVTNAARTSDAANGVASQSHRTAGPMLASTRTAVGRRRIAPAEERDEPDAHGSRGFTVLRGRSDHESLLIVVRTACAASRAEAVRDPLGTFAPVACRVVTVHCFCVTPCSRQRM